jgi:hypothetical protein
LTKEKKKRRKVPRGANHIPANSLFYERLLPIILVSLGIITICLILAAAGILFGVL